MLLSPEKSNIRLSLVQIKSKITENVIDKKGEFAGLISGDIATVGLVRNVWDDNCDWGLFLSAAFCVLA